ncbi:hypothetical protein F5X96DRAFT_642977 [Biscogniauxia mediterranea]|nr:hypothetical protein F5X96DRAFT_642977 [Biscogniauxia mediterranea]
MDSTYYLQYPPLPKSPILHVHYLCTMYLVSVSNFGYSQMNQSIMQSAFISRMHIWWAFQVLFKFYLVFNISSSFFGLLPYCHSYIYICHGRMPRGEMVRGPVQSDRRFHQVLPLFAVAYKLSQYLQ